MELTSDDIYLVFEIYTLDGEYYDKQQVLINKKQDPEKWANPSICEKEAANSFQYESEKVSHLNFKAKYIGYLVFVPASKNLDNETENILKASWKPKP